MAPVQEANSDDLGKSFDFIHNDCMLSVLIRIANIQFHDKMRKNPLVNICFLELVEEFYRD